MMAAMTSADETTRRLLDLQTADTEIDQLQHRRSTLPEREHLAAVSAELTQWERTRTAMRERLDELAGKVEEADAEAERLRAERERLEAQLKTVIAPREAEALMHEIETLNQRRDEIETAELEALEEQAQLDDDLVAHVGAESDLRTALGKADDALASAAGEVDREIADWTERRDAARAGLAEGVLARYDRVRSSSGVAVATLAGKQCTGCHLDLSAAEIDDVKDEAAASNGVADCPNCGRMLVVG